MEKHDKEGVDFLYRLNRRFDHRGQIILFWGMKWLVWSRKLSLDPLLKAPHFPSRAFPFRCSPEAISSESAPLRTLWCMPDLHRVVIGS